MLVLHDGKVLHIDSSADILEHYGVKGMKWGKRLRQYNIERIKKRSTELRAKNGDKLYLEKKTALSQKLFSNRANAYKNYTRLYNESGKRVGEFGYGTGGFSNKYGKIHWNGIDEQYRGRGYSQAGFNEVENRLKKEKGVKELRLDSVRREDARHIYDKNGYVEDNRKNFSNFTTKIIGLDPMVKKVR